MLSTGSVPSPPGALHRRLGWAAAWGEAGGGLLSLSLDGVEGPGLLPYLLQGAGSHGRGANGWAWAQCLCSHLVAINHPWQRQWQLGRGMDEPVLGCWGCEKGSC